MNEGTEKGRKSREGKHGIWCVCIMEVQGDEFKVLKL